MAKKKQFKAESKRLLDLMIHSIYTNKDIFLRELISNASDAEDKLYFKALQDTSLNVNRDDLKIELEVNEDKRQIKVCDYGIGMSKEELENNLGTIAHSDSKAFKDQFDIQSDIDVIGQFGVGFYAAFMVSQKVDVISKALGSEVAYRFSSDGIEGYTITEDTREKVGTDVILTLREGEDFDHYLKEYVIKDLVSRYSDYIRYPIILKEETLNSMVPIWKRSKKDVSDEDLNAFYKEKFHDYDDPSLTIQMHIEGSPSFDALIFIPNHAPRNFYSVDYETGLQLYSRGVFIMEHNKTLVPECFRFVRGLVDSPDLPLNISREILQDDRQLSNIASRIKKKIKRELEKLMTNDREKYESFWKNFGMAIKYGIYDRFGADKDFLKDLVLINSSYESKETSFKEYLERMKENQEHIYYVSADTIEKGLSLPQTEYVRSKGYEVLILTDDIDEFMLQVMHEYEGKSFKSISQGDLELESDDEKQALEEKSLEVKDTLTAIKNALEGKVDDVVLSNRLIEDPVILSSREGLSLEMEKVLKNMPDAPKDLKAQRVLEINPNHPLLKALETLKNQEDLKDVAEILYGQALLIEGLPLENPVVFSQKLADLIVRSTK